MSGMRKSVTRSIDWYQKFLVSWLAARYSAVFVFYEGVVEGFGELYVDHTASIFRHMGTYGGGGGGCMFK